MNVNLIAYLRSISLVLVVLFSPVAANAYTSSGADGVFQPTTSVIFDSTQSIFNFTDISISSGVTIDFSGLTSTQPIELLATGNIDIAGTINMGTNSLWIETPGNLSFSGTVNGSGNTLSMVASTVNFTGTSNVNMPGGTISLATNSAVGTITGGGANATICISNNCSNITPVGNGSTTPILLGGTLITGGDNTISLAPVPEPSIWAMFTIGLFVLYAASRLRDRTRYLAWSLL